ncbi:hypothetical protein MMC12_005821 [Toensbergia leucococca]|nr:hypothetical protein [Toensbergia leucococca]
MAFIHSSHLGFHEGEEKMRSLLHVPAGENPTSPFLTPGAAYMLQTAPLLAIGILDIEGRPWSTIWGGDPGFARPLAQSIIGVKTLASGWKHDPVIEALIGIRKDEDFYEEKHHQAVVSGLTIDLASRSRIKFSGKVAAVAFERPSSDIEEQEAKIGQVQLVLKIEQSLGNCPKYLNKKQIIASLPEPKLISNSLPFPQSAIELLGKTDLFFISSSNHDSSMGTNYRGGPPGFVRVIVNDESGTTLAYPEYSGNRLYQTLGNLQTTPKAGLVFPDFDTGDVLYITGTTEILFGKEAAALLPRSNLAVKIRVTAVRFVQRGLPFRGELGERSPYNPPVRFLASERALPDAQSAKSNVVYAKMVKREIITPTIARYRFSVSDPEAAGRWEPGQYVALAFEDEVGMGYSHMRDDDPKSLNDDYVRTFTVSSPPGAIPEDEFEITVRNVGAVTNFLLRRNMRAGLEVPLRGFGGTFSITQAVGEVVPFIAGGIGITPLLGQLPDLAVENLRLFWTINIRDIGLVVDTFKRCPSLAHSTKVFVSGVDAHVTRNADSLLKNVELSDTVVITRRLLASDLQKEQNFSWKWYICTGSKLRKGLLGWLKGKEVVYEDFDY